MRTISFSRFKQGAVAHDFWSATADEACYRTLRLYPHTKVVVMKEALSIQNFTRCYLLCDRNSEPVSTKRRSQKWGSLTFFTWNHKSNELYHHRFRNTQSLFPPLSNIECDCDCYRFIVKSVAIILTLPCIVCIRVGIRSGHRRRIFFTFLHHAISLVKSRFLHSAAELLNQ